MILSNSSIHEAMDDGRLVIDPEPSPRTLTRGDGHCPYSASAVDLSLGGQISIYQAEDRPVHVDLRRGLYARFGSDVMATLEITRDQPFTLQPGRFVLGRTYEKVALPPTEDPDGCLAARVEGRSSYAVAASWCTSPRRRSTPVSPVPSRWR